MNRALKATPYTLKATLFSGSVATDPSPDSATIEVVGADGTSVVAAGSGTTPSGVGGFTRSLTPAQTGLLDRLEARWTATIGGQVTTVKTYTEIAGGFLCSLTDLKVIFPTKTDDELAAIRTATEQRLESACGHAFVPRMAVETRSAGNYSQVWFRFHLSWPDIRAIRFVTVGGVNLTASQIAGLTVTRSGIVSGIPRATTTGLSTITIGYEYGRDLPDEIIGEAMVMAATEIFSGDGNEGLVTRRMADNQAIWFAPPTMKGAFQNPVLQRIVQNYQTPWVA